MNMWYWNNVGMNIFQWYDIVMISLNWKRERWRRWGQHRVQVSTLAHDSDTCRGPEIQKYKITAQSKQYKCKNTKIQKINAKGLISQNYKIFAERKKRTHKTQSLSRIPTPTWNAFHIFNNCQRDEECKCCAKRLQPPLLCPDLVHTIAQSPGQCHTSTWNISDNYFFSKRKSNCPFSSDIGANCKRQDRYHSNHHKPQSY